MSRAALTVGVALALALAACGARTDLESRRSSEPGGTGGGGSYDLCNPAGVRLCGGPCPPADELDCPGVGCTATADRSTEQALDMGVCWSDLDDWINYPCVACRDGETCVHRADGGLWCAPLEVCHALYAAGEETACRYADKSSFHDQQLIELAGCPAEPGLLCGGGCGECVVGERCTGRSAHHPYGVCLELAGIGDERWCVATRPEEGSPCFSVQYCARFVVPEEDVEAATSYSVCAIKDDCLAWASLGIVECFDASGRLVEPN